MSEKNMKYRKVVSCFSIFSNQPSAIGPLSASSGSLGYHGRTLMSVNENINVKEDSSNYWSSKYDQPSKHIRLGI